MDPNTVDPSTLFSVKGMVVVITGGATGIGLMMTKAFANNGAAKVYIVGRRKEKLEEAARTASQVGNVVPIIGDVCSKASLMKVAERVKQEVGHVNLLCCNSGTCPPLIGVKSKDVSIGEFADRCLQLDPGDWNGEGSRRRMLLTSDAVRTTLKHVRDSFHLFADIPGTIEGFATNTTGVAFTSFAFLKLLHAGNSTSSIPSQILVTTSIAGYSRNPNSFGIYPLTKAATTHLIKGLSGTLAPYNIRVNGIAPGVFPTDLAAGLIAAMGVTKDGQDLSVTGTFPKEFIPATRAGSRADMAGTVLYMASQAGAYMNGCILVVDGGRITQLPGTY
ncbi:Short-chain dehydrogenase/reductase VdtF, partial [Pseudocercospora fuligena]